MAFGDDWDSQKMLDLYIHDYMIKKNMHSTAEIFAKEANVCHDPIVKESSEGLLTEWWTVFWDIYSSRQQNHPGAMQGSSFKAPQMTENSLQNLSPVLPVQETNLQRPAQFPVGMDFDKMLGQPGLGLLAAKLYQEEHLGYPARDLNSNRQLLDVNKLALSKPSSSNSSYNQQQMSNNAQQWIAKDNRYCTSLGRTFPMDSILYGVPNAIYPGTGLHETGMGNGVHQITLSGWPLSEVDHPGYQILNSLAPLPNQPPNFQTAAAAAHQQQNLLAQVKPAKPISSFPGSTSNLSNTMLSRSELIRRDGQMKFQMKQTMEKQQKQRQLYENCRRRKNLSYLPAAGIALNGKDAKTYKPLDARMESFLSHEDANADVTCTLRTSQRPSAACNKNEQKGFSFDEVGCLQSSKSKVLCCHFSSQGNLLASAGQGKKVSIWKMGTFDFVDTAEGHSDIITDVRFKPCSTVFATSSFDKTVQIWDAASPHKSSCKLLGHIEQIMSVDFHPQNTDLLCSCDISDEIRFWNIHQSACTHISKGATRQVRFQPRFGDFLAAAAGNVISLIDIETNNLQYCLKGHAKEVHSICWDISGKYIASVSEDSACVWSTIAGGKCIHELHSNGKKFECCAFHPGYSQLLVLGCYQSIELWNPTASNTTLTIPAHNDIITALADSPKTEIIASASHDRYVKLWK